MMVHALLFGSSFLVAFSGAVMPGPVLAVTITQASRIGYRAGPLIMTGHAFLEAALLGLLFVGLAGVIDQPRVIGSVGLAGSVVLFWMAHGMLRGIGSLSLTAPVGGSRIIGPVAAGVLTSLSNPYWFLWWATIGLGYLMVSMKSGWSGVMAFFAGHLIADFAWYTLVSYLVWKGRDRIGDGAYRVMIAVCAIALFGFGIYFGINSLRALV